MMRLIGLYVPGKHTRTCWI